MILDSVDYAQIGASGFMQLNANKLSLQGTNKIMSKGIISVLAPTLELNVVKEIVSNDSGKLLLMALGSDYVKKDQK